jgi:hypothetical protein
MISIPLLALLGDEMMQHRRNALTAACLAVGLAAMLAAGVAQAETILVGPIDFDSNSDLTDNFGEIKSGSNKAGFPGYLFARSGGPGCDTVLGEPAGRVSMTGSNKPGSCVYDSDHNATWGPDNQFENVKITTWVLFGSELLHSGDDPTPCRYGISFNIDENREPTGTAPDCLILSLINGTEAGEADQVVLSRGSARDCDWGTTIASTTLTGDAIPLGGSGGAVEDELYFRLDVTITNNPDDSLTVDAKLSDPLNNYPGYLTTPVTFSTTQAYADLDGAATQGEIGVMASTDYYTLEGETTLRGYKNPVKWDNFTITQVPEPGMLALGLIGLICLSIRRAGRS